MIPPLKFFADLGKHLAQAVEDVGWGRVLHIAHSGGALITYLAAQHHLTPRRVVFVFFFFSFQTSDLIGLAERFACMASQP